MAEPLMLMLMMQMLVLVLMLMLMLMLFFSPLMTHSALTLLLAEPPLLDFLLICLDFSLILYAFFLASYDSLSLTPLLAEPPVFLTAQPAAAPLGLSKHPSPPPPDTFAPTLLSCIYFSFSSLNCLVCFSACDKFDRQI